MDAQLLVSIIINNYNYDYFLREAIDSALNQTYSNIEVLVVDDGSTDNSREIIASYENRIIPILKENGGQASCLNEGFMICKGEIILFLDSDDSFCRDKVEKIVDLFAQVIPHDPYVILHNMHEIVDKQNLPTGISDISGYYQEWDCLSKIRDVKGIERQHLFFNV